MVLDRTNKWCPADQNILFGGLEHWTQGLTWRLGNRCKHIPVLDVCTRQDVNIGPFCLTLCLGDVLGWRTYNKEQATLSLRLSCLFLVQWRLSKIRASVIWKKCMSSVEHPFCKILPWHLSLVLSLWFHLTSNHTAPISPCEASVSCKGLLSGWICTSQTTYGIYFHIMYTAEAQFLQQAYLWIASILFAVIPLSSSSSRSELSDGGTGGFKAGVWANQPISRPRTKSPIPARKYL